MSLPTDALASAHVQADLLAPDSTRRRNRLVDYERAGIAVQDPTHGINIFEWTAQMSGNDVRLFRTDGSNSPVTLFTLAGITHISLAFDGNMNPAIAYVAGGQAYLWWYDATIPGHTVLTLDPDARSPYITMDDKRHGAEASNDILLFYCRGHQLMYRQSRDRFLVERLLQSFPGAQISVRGCGMSRGNRMQIDMVGSDNYIDHLVTYASAWTAAVYDVSSSSFAAALPSGLTSDTLLLAFVMTRNGGGPAAGWTLVAEKQCTDGTTTQKLAVYRKNTVASGDSGASVTWAQGAALRIGVAYLAVRRSDGSTPAVTDSGTTAVDSTSTMSVTPPVLTATAYQELFVMAATSIVGTATDAPPTAPIHSSLRSGSSAQTRLGVAVRARFAQRRNAGSFTFPASVALNGLAAITLRISA